MASTFYLTSRGPYGVHVSPKMLGPLWRPCVPAKSWGMGAVGVLIVLCRDCLVTLIVLVSVVLSLLSHS